MANAFIFLALISLALLIIGLIKPSVFSRTLNANRKRIALVFGGGFILCFILFGITSDATREKEESAMVPRIAKPTSSSSNDVNADLIKGYAEESPLNFVFDSEREAGGKTQLTGWSDPINRDPIKTSHIIIGFDKATKKIAAVSLFLVEDSYNIPQTEIDKVQAFAARLDSAAGKFVGKNLSAIEKGKMHVDLDFESHTRRLHFQVIENVSDARALEARDGRKALSGYDYYIGVEITQLN